MVHILLLVLKIIGIVLLILLAALLLAVAVLLFVPVRYRGRLQKPEDGWRRFAAAGKISWLFRAVALDAVYENGSFFGCVRLFGLPVRRFGGRREGSGGQGKTPGHGKEDETAKRSAGEKAGKTPGKAVEESVTSEASYEPLEAAEDRIAKELPAGGRGNRRWDCSKGAQPRWQDLAGDFCSGSEGFWDCRGARRRRPAG